MSSKQEQLAELLAARAQYQEKRGAFKASIRKSSVKAKIWMHHPCTRTPLEILRILGGRRLQNLQNPPWNQFCRFCRVFPPSIRKSSKSSPAGGARV